jgi:hypothetical protein
MDPDPQPQVQAVLGCLPAQITTLTDNRTGLSVDVRIIDGDPRPLAARIAGRVVRSLADQYPTTGMIPVGTLRHMADEIEETT